MKGFQVGDRVKLKSDLAAFCKTPFSKFAAEGRIGTVWAVYGTAIPVRERTFAVVFDVKRKGAAPQDGCFKADAIELVVSPPSPCGEKGE